MKNNRKLTITTQEEFSFHDLALMISRNVSNEDIPALIAYLDRIYEDWDVTVSIIKHFEHLKAIAIDEDIEKDFIPEEIKTF